MKVKKNCKRKRLCVVAFLLCCVSLVVSIVLLVKMLIVQKVQQTEMEELQTIVHKSETKQDAGLAAENERLIKEKKENTPSEVDIDLKGLLQLKQQNTDLVGWITIPETAIDYPVMQSEDQEDYYLNHDFYKKENKYGVPFIDSSCDLKNGCDNIIIYGHHMKDGTMFAELLDYKDVDHYIDHPYIRFSTLTGSKTYEIISVFTEQFAVIDDNSFLFHRFTKAKTHREFDDYIQKAKERSLYEITTIAEYGDQLLTLSTCDQTVKDGRFIIVAKETKE